ncbi:TRAP transporter substrate-binding protein [Woeseia oceani]|uniref:ABC transporter substrate-binding protein n=1 Tax=Woeseia oceani TaxID=1548547 RepID=A0A193LKB6_9GAMM|nr:TRAP transporter substrate-binding protein [Woeseia oceani]ANO52844.1 ABC transporter substrate-binding protein [Woeseia oceani]
MKRRAFVGTLAAAAGVAACSQESASSGPAASQQTFRWNMVTSWPPGLPGLGIGAENLARRIERATAGRLKIQVYAGGELVPALEVFDAVRAGTAQMGHDASYYHRGKVPAAQYFTTIPFALNGNEINAWMYYGGGLKLWRELYDEFGLVPFPAGQTGVQMAGWFNKEINSVADLKGLKMRIPGLGGEVMQRAGATQVTVPASEIFTSLQTGAIDAAEWVGPYNDLSLGLHKAARYYYYPGWHEPGPLIECIVNKEAWQTLPEDLQEIVSTTCQAINLDIQSEYMYGNAQALHELMQQPDVEVRELPEDVLDLLAKHSSDVANELVARDPWAKRLQDSVAPFMKKSTANQRVSEFSYLRARMRLDDAS